MANPNCELYPKIGDEDSKLYKDLLQKIGDRPVTNYIYASYLQEGVADQMDSDGKDSRDKLGQHLAKDVYDFFNVAKIINQRNNRQNIEKAIGARDSNGDVILYDNPFEALQIANDFNQQAVQNNNKGLVTSVGQNGDKFFIKTERLDAKTHIRVAEVEEQLKLWDVIKDFFNDYGVDIESAEYLWGKINPIQGGQNLINYLTSLRDFFRANLISVQDIQALLTLDEHTSQVQRLKQAYGTIEEVARIIYESYRDPSVMTPSKRALRDSIIENNNTLQQMDLDSLKARLEEVSGNFREDSKEWDLKRTYDELAKKYNLEAVELKLSREISTLSEAVGEGILRIQRKLRQAKRHGDIEEARRLQDIYKTLMKELEGQKFYSGILYLLDDCLTSMGKIDEILSNVNTAGTAMEVAISKSRAIAEIEYLKNTYYHIVNALTNIDKIIIDEYVSDRDRKNIERIANEVKKTLDDRQKVVDGLKREVMADMVTEIIGEKDAKGRPITELLDVLDKDVGFSDKLYSMARSSNPLIASIGTIIRDAQDKRTVILNDMKVRIRRATHRLHKSGSTSDQFMYDETNHFVSDIDWAKYESAKDKYRRYLYVAKDTNGKPLYNKFDIMEKMEEWEQRNTEDRVVDKKNNRTERVPNKKYRTGWDKSQLTPAQQHYYDEIMQIKGELGSMLPEFARDHYLPPQIRMSNRNMAAKGRIGKAAKNMMKDFWTIREDDTDYASTGVIMGEDVYLGEGDMNDRAVQQIPIHFLNKLEDQSELLKDASGAIERFATTAINYHMMEGIKDLVETMADYVKKLEPAHTNSKGDGVVEMANGKNAKVAKKITRVARKYGLQELLDAQIQQHIYGVKKDRESKKAHFIDKLLRYTSVKNLAMNVKGFVANEMAGELQMMIEATSGEFYDWSDLVWAHNKLVFSGRYLGRIFGLDLNNKRSKLSLIAELFDPTSDMFSESRKARYHKNWLTQLISGDFTFMGYSSGEQIIHLVNLLAILRSTKVLKDGKKISLWKALKVGKIADGNGELMLEPNVTDLDGNQLNGKFMDIIKKRIRYANQTCHGSMNEEDKGIIHQQVVGRAVMNFRQWMVEHYSRRFRKMHYEGTLREFREGYYTSFNRWVLGGIAQITKFQARSAIKWKDMDDGQRANVRRAFAEMILILGGLSGVIALMGDPDDHKGEHAWRFWNYIFKRLRLETFGSIPVGVLFEQKTLLNSPIAATNVINGMLYPFFSYKDWDRTLKSGPYKGWNAFYANLVRYTVPFAKDIKQFMEFGDDESVMRIFDAENMYK